MTLRYLSLFSGIEAATAAWSGLGWQCVGVSEIEPFPCRVLAAHHPHVPNLGDVTKVTEEQVAALGQIDLVVFGSPCQDLSVAGRRKGLDGARSGLFFTAMQIVEWARVWGGCRFALWENVPGAFTSNKGRDFAVVVDWMAGLDGTEPPPKGWGSEGCAVGTEAMVEWATLDAQWFGVAQRRRRVFALADFGDWTRRPPLLLEPQSLRGDSAPSRGAGETVAPTIRAGAPNGGAGHGARSGDRKDELIVPVFEQRPVLKSWPAEVARTLNAHYGDKWGLEDQHALNGGELFVPAVCATGAATHALTADGFDASEDGTGRGTPIVHVPEIAATLVARSSRGGQTNSPGYNADETCIAFHHNAQACQLPSADRDTSVSDSLTCSQQAAVALFTTQPLQGDEYACASQTNPGTLLRALQREVGEETFTKWGLGILNSLQPSEVLRQALYGSGIRPAAFSRSWVVNCALPRTQDGSCWLLLSLQEAGCQRCAPQGWQPPEQLARELGAYLSELSQPGPQIERFVRDLWFAAEGVGLLRQALSAIQEVGRSVGRETEPARLAAQVRRLTVTECEFLQGFPRGFTAIPGAKDGPRYKALGNSMAVPVMRWIGQRVDFAWRWF